MRQPPRDSDIPVEQKSVSPTTGAEPTTTAPDAANPASSSKFRHELRNLLHGILMQVRCAQIAVDKADASATRKHLDRIESSVNLSHQLVDEFTPRSEDG